MKKFAQVVLSASLSLALMGGVSLTLTGCSADTLSGPGVEAYTDTDGGTGSAGSDHNTRKAPDGGDGGTGSAGSDHNTDG